MAQTNKQAINFTTQVCARKAFDEKALKCIWQILFLFAWLNLPNVLRSIATFFFDSDFPAPCFDVPKASNFTSGGVQNRETKTRRLGTIVTSFPDFKLRENQISPIFAYFLINNTLMYHFLANWLAHNEKMTEKSVFREDWSPEMTSESFPISCFGLAVLYPTGSEIWRFWYIKTGGRKIAIKNFSLLYISVHWGDLIEKIKKKYVIANEPSRAKTRGWRGGSSIEPCVLRKKSRVFVR